MEVATGAEVAERWRWQEDGGGSIMEVWQGGSRMELAEGLRRQQDGGGSRMEVW